MAYLADILSSEQEAEKIRTKAREDAAKILSQARDAASTQLAQVETSLKEEATEKLETEKKTLATHYRSIVKRGEVRSDEAISESKKKEAVAISHVIKELI